MNAARAGRHAFTGNTAIVRHRCHRVLEGVGPQRAAPGHRGRATWPSRDAGIEPGRGGRAGDLQLRHQPRDRDRPQPGHGGAHLLQPHPLRRRGRAAPPSSRRPWPCARGWPTSWSATGPSTSARGTGSAPASRADHPSPTPRPPTSPGTRPSGLLTPAQWVAMAAQRYLHVTGATSEDLGRVAVADRKHAATNPKAWFYEKPSPSRTTRPRAGSSSRSTSSTAARRPTAARRWWSPPSSGPATCASTPVVIEAAAQGAGPGQEMMTSYYYDDLCGLGEMAVGGPPAVADLGPDARRHPDRRALRPLHPLRPLPTRGARASAARARPRTSCGTATSSSAGGLPINTHGGQLGEAYLHGMNGIAEGVRQVRGTSVEPGPRGLSTSLVTAGTGVPTSGLILGVDR